MASLRLRKLPLSMLVIGLAVALATTLIIRGQNQYHPTLLDYAKLNPGMSENDVKSILGPPHEILTWKSHEHKILKKPQSPKHKIWVYYGPIQEEGHFRSREMFHLNFDEEGILGSYGNGSDFELAKPPLVERLLRWLKNIFVLA